MRNITNSCPVSANLIWTSLLIRCLSGFSLFKCGWECFGFRSLQTWNNFHLGEMTSFFHVLQRKVIERHFVCPPCFCIFYFIFFLPENSSSPSSSTVPFHLCYPVTKSPFSSWVKKGSVSLTSHNASHKITSKERESFVNKSYIRVSETTNMVLITFYII